MKWSPLLALVVACSDASPPGGPLLNTQAKSGSSSGSSSGSLSGRPGSSGGSGGASSGGLTAAEFTSQVYTAMCNATAACCSAYGLTYALNCGTIVSGASSPPDALQTFSPSTAAACLTALARARGGCTVPTAVTANCFSKVWVGTLQPGDVCRLDADCAPPGPSSAAGSVSRCSTDLSLESTGFCYSSQMTNTAGAPCEQPVGPGQTQSTSCGSELYCAGSSLSAQGTCQPLPGLGAACVAGGCQANLYCNASQVCTALLAPLAGCTAIDVCEPGYACGPSNQCIAQVPDGKNCDPTANWQQCLNTSNCDAVARVCIPGNSFAAEGVCDPNNAR